MYDARQEPNEFVADSLASAKAKAAEFFGTDEGDLKIIVNDGQRFKWVAVAIADCCNLPGAGTE